MKNTEKLLEFSLSLADELLSSGSSLERVNDTVRRVCYSYEIEELSMYSLSSVMMLSARTKDGETVQRQHNMRTGGIELTKLSRLNALSRRVSAEKPDPTLLQGMLAEAVNVKDYPRWLVLMGQVLALCCLCRIFGGGVGDTIVAGFITAVMFYMGVYLKKPWLNEIVYNAVTSFVAGILSIICVRIGFAEHPYVLMITGVMMLLPGVPLVNATSNLFCGNEMNGLLELLKVVVETLAVVGGFAAAMFLFGGGIA